MKNCKCINEENLIDKYKVFIKTLFLLSLCMAVFSVFITSNALADNIVHEAFNISAYKIAGPYFRIAIVACEPYLGIMIIGICENLNSFFGKPLDIQSTLAGNHIILSIVIIMFVATKFLKSNSGTKIFGMVSLGEIEKKLAVVFPIILGGINIYMILKYGNIDNSESVGNNDTFMIVFTVLLSIISVIVCYIIKTVVGCIEVLQLSLSFIPGFSLFCEIVKSLFVIFLLWLSAINPTISIIINLIIISISAIVFKKCLSVTLYYRNIYLEPFLGKLGFRTQKSRINNKKVFNNICKWFGSEDIRLLIPVFSNKRNKDFKKYQMWYLVCLNDEIYLYRDALFKKNRCSIQIINHNNIFIAKHKRFIEFFTVFNMQNFIFNNYKKPNKDMSFVFSNDYADEFDNILNILKFISIY